METFNEMKDRMDREVEEAGVPTEAEMRAMKAPAFDTLDELNGYITALVDRPHTYGTCVYAMSLAAVASFNYVARKLGATGFQASCADLDVLRQTRRFEWGKLLDYQDLLYPQYCTTEHFPTAWDVIRANKDEFSKRARALLAESNGVAPESVVEHWKWLASLSPEEGSNSNGAATPEPIDAAQGTPFNLP